MIGFLFSLPPWVGCAVVMVSTAVMGFVVYLVFYKFLSKYKSEDMKDSIPALFRAVGIFVSLMLALAFSEVLAEQRKIRNSLQREAVAISDIYSVLKQFDIEKTREIRTILIDYAQAVIDDDWPALANDKLGQRTYALKRQLVKGVINLKPSTPIQEKMWSNILTDIDRLSDYRLVRLDSAVARPAVYVYVIIFGFMITMECFGVYRPQAPLIALVTLYMIFVGLVLYLVLALSDPFQSGIGVAPTSFEYLVETLPSDIR